MELKRSQKAAFGFGAFGKDVVYMLIASYLLYYYNAVLGMNSVFIGAMMMAARVFDAFNDPIMGIVVAKTKTKWGKFRPWILAGTVLNAVTVYALYATPEGMAESGQRVWLTVFYFAWGITYTLMDIPFWSMIPAVTRAGKDREQLSSLARACAGVGDALPTVLTMVVVPLLSASDQIADFRIGFKWWALIIAVMFVISEYVCVRFVPEKTENLEEEEPMHITDMFKALLHNDQAMVIVVSVILVYAALNIVGNLILYFFTYDVCNTDAYSVFVAGCFLAQVLVMAIVPAFRKMFSKKQLFVGGFFIQILGFLLIILMSYTNLYNNTSWLVLLIPGVLVYAGYGMLNVLLTIYLSDTVDYGEYQTGKREEAVIFSMQTFTVKLASGLAVLIAGIVIDLIGLDTSVIAQSQATINGLRLWMTVPSIVLLIIGVIVYLKFYLLDDEMMDMITKEISGGKQEA